MHDEKEKEKKKSIEVFFNLYIHICSDINGLHIFNCIICPRNKYLTSSNTYTVLKSCTLIK